MNNRFEIIDGKGIIESGFKTFEEALSRLNKLIETEFDFYGRVKIIEVYYVYNKKRSV